MHLLHCSFTFSYYNTDHLYVTLNQVQIILNVGSKVNMYSEDYSKAKSIRLIHTSPKYHCTLIDIHFVIHFTSETTIKTQKIVFRFYLHLCLKADNLLLAMYTRHELFRQSFCSLLHAGH